MVKNKQLKGLIFNIQRYSIYDGAGIRTLVFMKGCPLNCFWCSNPESQFPFQEVILEPSKCIGCGRCIEVCPTGAAKIKNQLETKKICINCGKCVEVCPSNARQMFGRYMNVKDIMKEVEKDLPFYRGSGGVTVSGGEPLMQADFIKIFLKNCLRKGINTTIETCGYAKWEDFEKVLEYSSCVLYDIKHMDSQKHREITGVGNELILQNAKKIAALGKNMIIRVPIIPGYNDSFENIEAIARFANILRIEEIHLLPYHRLGESKYYQLGRNYKLRGIRSPNKEFILKRKKIMELFNLKIRVYS